MSLVQGDVFHDSPSDERSLLKLRAEMDKLSLQLIQNACKLEKPVLALDVCFELHLEKSFDAAIKLAQFHRMHVIA